MKKIEDNNTLVFIVDTRASKRQITEAVRRMYEIKTAKVNTLIRCAAPELSPSPSARLAAPHTSVESRHGGELPRGRACFAGSTNRGAAADRGAAAAAAAAVVASSSRHLREAARGRRHAQSRRTPRSSPFARPLLTQRQGGRSTSATRARARPAARHQLHGCGGGHRSLSLSWSELVSRVPCVAGPAVRARAGRAGAGRGAAGTAVLSPLVAASGGLTRALPHLRPDGLKKAYVRLTTDYDALDVANKIGII